MQGRQITKLSSTHFQTKPLFFYLIHPLNECFLFYIAVEQNESYSYTLHQSFKAP